METEITLNLTKFGYLVVEQLLVLTSHFALFLVLVSILVYITTLCFFFIF